MTQIDQLFKRVEELAHDAKARFRAKGIILPVENLDKSVSIGEYRIVKNNGVFMIYDEDGQIVQNHINLPQTALIVANELALGYNGVSSSILIQDQEYGAGIFEDQYLKQVAQKLAKKQDWDRYDTVLTKQEIAHSKAIQAKQAIRIRFEKLSRLR